jgi:asparagine synthase (glutamine-hydrolysing)
MCGLVGFLGGEDLDAKIIKNMADAIYNRGPDDSGYWCDQKQSISLGHRRLSIIDLSSAGHQPMISADGRYVLVFNGEIYNHLELRKKLALMAPAWRGNSDTETLLACLATWGIEKCLEYIVGMFAFALWDRVEKVLFLARDRFGEKPLYYGWQGYGSKKTFLFGSDIKALKLHPAFNSEISRESLSQFMMFNNVPGVNSIYRGVSKLMPGNYLRVSLKARDPIIISYWDAYKVALDARSNSFEGSEEEAAFELDKLLKKVIKGQMLSDAPLGAFLSGGVDSSLIAAIMQSLSDVPIKTFSIGFSENAYNEAPFAAKVAKHLGTDHTECYINPQQAMDIIPKIPSLFSEPFADSSQIPMFLVSSLARESVKVALSGDAGDEIFAGYNRYSFVENYWKLFSKVPITIRSILSRTMKQVSTSSWDNFLYIRQISNQWSDIGHKIQKITEVLDAKNSRELYLKLISHWRPVDSVVVGAESNFCLDSYISNNSHLTDVEYMMLMDTKMYLPDDILVKVDRASMGVSLETRTPYLDHRVFEFAWSLPLNYKLRKPSGYLSSKWILRQVLNRYVPSDLINRPKMGFAVPIDSWLRGPLREWAESLLDERAMLNDGYLNPIPIQRKWKEHISGRRNWQHLLWNVLMFQSWMLAQKERN